jgi:homoserine O-succinyltransferase
MPLVAHNNLPSYERLRAENQYILSRERAQNQDIRPMHIGVLNMMPDAALEATERQFLSLIGESNKLAQIYVHLFTLPELERGPEAKAHIEKYYSSFSQIKKDGLDGLIITGANVVDPDLTKAPFYAPLEEVIDWAWDNVASTVFSCLATHALMALKYGQKRSLMPEKLWGVYTHKAADIFHPLVQGLNTDFDVPHSRNNTITREQFENAGLRILIDSDEAGVHVVSSKDGFRRIMMQGHPEYDIRSLLKEYIREIKNYAEGRRVAYPPYPAHFMPPQAQELCKRYKDKVKPGEILPDFPEDVVLALVKNNWHDTGRSLIGNWLGFVYQTTSYDRTQQYMDGVDPENPLGLNFRGQNPAARAAG